MTAHDIETAATLLPLFAQAAARTPDRIAVQDERRALSFAALAGEIDALAGALRSRIRPGEHVAVRLPRGLEYIVAAYAIWQAEGVYVPLDEHWPQARIDTILAHAHIRLLIHAGAGGMQLTMQADAAAPAAAEATAYLIHTSGTTGTPKGIAVGHAALLHLVASHQRCIYAPQNMMSGAVALNASFCFDSALERMALVALGYTVHVVADAIRKSPLALIRYLGDHQIANVDLVPSHLRVLMRNDLAAGAPGLTLVIVGGEAIDSSLWQALATSRIVFFNVYGPSENTINTTFCQVQGDTPNIGRPFDGVGCAIVAANGRRCVTGEEGELWLSGRHLALGYYNDPVATGNAFVTRDGVRCYRTGDLARRGDDGLLYFLGRLDEQVKINGHRIELSDVQHHLASLPGVAQAAVSLIRRPDGARLLASIVREEGQPALECAALAGQLAARVPAYMVPDHWQVLAALPLTGNLKLDHHALQQAWAQQAAGSDHSGRETWRSSEHALHAIWQRVLSRNGLALDDHFFASGGDSLAAMNLLVELDALVAGEVELSVIFKHPTIRTMAVWLETRRPGAATGMATAWT